MNFKSKSQDSQKKKHHSTHTHSSFYVLPWQNDILYIYMTNEYITSYFADMLKKTQIHCSILQPCQFQVTINIRTICESIP